MKVSPHRIASTKRKTRGLTLLEVSISMMIVATVLLASAQTFGTTLKASGQAQRTTNAAVFLETALEDLGAQPFASVLTLNGETLFDGVEAGSSRYSITLGVFLVDPNLLQIDAELTDLSSGNVLGRLASQRSRR